MSQSNPFLKFPGRASYELSYLLRELPRHLHAEGPLTDEQCLMVEAASLQSLNYSDTVLHGLEALGRVMWSASVNKESPPDICDFGAVGQLVTELAVQLQFLGEFSSEIHDHDLRNAQTAKGGRK